MKLIKTPIKDLYVIEPKIFGDNRGYFFESYKKNFFEEHIGKVNFIQDNESMSSYGVLRGLHYQIAPYEQAKLVRVIKGRVLDVAVDIRKNSETFGKHFSIELSEENKKQMFIPSGFAHGFVVLSDLAIFSYKVDNLYSPENERGIKCNDNDLNIDWKIEENNLILSDKDKILPSFKEFSEKI